MRNAREFGLVDKMMHGTFASSKVPNRHEAKKTCRQIRGSNPRLSAEKPGAFINNVAAGDCLQPRSFCTVLVPELSRSRTRPEVPQTIELRETSGTICAGVPATMLVRRAHAISTIPITQYCRFMHSIISS